MRPGHPANYRTSEEDSLTHPIAYSALARVDAEEALTFLNHLVAVGLLIRHGVQKHVVRRIAVGAVNG